MEARSLASLNLLAANPPSYPVKPNEQPLEPLVLYLARVPGTRDIILSPFKPQLKNVTAEDVASSLYYVHLELHPTDITTTPPPPIRHDEGGRSSEESGSSMNIPRKPLPLTTTVVKPATPPRDLSVPSGRPNDQLVNLAPPPLFSQPERSHDLPQKRPLPHSNMHPVTGGVGVSTTTNPAGAISGYGTATTTGPGADATRLAPIAPESMVRKPLGPRPNRAHSDTRHLAPTYGEDRPPQANRLSLQNPPVLRQPAPPTTEDTRGSRSPSPRLGNHPNSTPFTLTLIRRDPGTGHQWNVGQISSYQLGRSHEESSGLEDQGHYFPNQPPSPTRARLPDSPIDIRIETSGYAKFRNRAAGRPADIQGLAALARAHDTANLTMGGMFARRVTMAYTKSWTSNLRDKFVQARNRHSRSISSPSTDSFDLDPQPDASSGAHESGPGPGMKPRGFAFTSPWDGRCEFRTGNGGRSLRCHHLLHDGQTAAYNPLVADSNEGVQRAPSNVVSELRFNLPSSELLGAPAAPGTGTTGHDGMQDDSKIRRLGHFAKLLRPGAADRSSSGDDYLEDDYYEDAVSPFDVNVGRERAGGGNRGKRAKLGKLIVYNDGLKMLDLLVAANIGVWWLSWERSF